MVCLLCGYKAKDVDLKSGEVVTCPHDGCKGVYCKQCFTDINNKCTLCSNPISYGDATDISEEKYTRLAIFVNCLLSRLLCPHNNNMILR